MITDPCDCGIKPESHAHIMNKGENYDKPLFLKGVPVSKDEVKNEGEIFAINLEKIMPYENDKESKSYCSDCGNEITEYDCAWNVCDSCRIEL